MQIKKINQGCIATTKACPAPIEPQWFTHAYWQQREAITGSSRGRYITWFLQYEQQDWVLRHYYRGGLIEKLSKDAYLFTGYHKTRAVAELQLLEQLYDEGFPVPEPVAALVQRSGIHYRADILIKRIHGAQDLVAALMQPLSPDEWQSLGACIAQFHQRGVYHADLNAKNILLAEKQFYLIDFDRGTIKTPQAKWQQSNLDRLLRSFNKEKNKQPQLHFSAENWQDLLKGYRAQMARS
ncbi:3-deoxy-D-manno-octulosonic acid kinase [Shewanella gelidii]|uniref:3-deoxy-D-manno-octulosonic acid kinase n=1 Tax=Shewanella gelidii TaxID=1642821 RepID=A0A917JQ02_9GAMM|nr:3-deoxy-D-manno-octulosonic acid kinase [Shewanella gelidii]MCL1099169.1 3-deoxy-D-manno-octulosonic acid kinase [Shewanella gelidii]GGI81182.1 3-deoxy-D-manno-octulosonic acid kinase [Shewanella gelidii]